MAYQYIARKRRIGGGSALQMEAPPLSDAEQLARSIANSQTRLQSIGETPTEAPIKTPLLLKALNALDKPRAAVWTGIEHAVKGQDIGQGIAEGWKGGEDAYSGQDLMTDVFGQQSENAGFAEKAARGVGAFATEALLDPLNLVTLGAGSLAKGVLTKGAGVVTTELAEGLAKQALRKAAPELVQKVAKKELIQRGLPATAADVAAHAATLSSARIDAALAKAGVQAAPGATNLADATRLIAAQEASNASKVAGKGMSIAGQTIVSDQTLQKAGGAIRAGIDKIPVLGKVMSTITETAGKVFDPKYILGIGDAGREIMHRAGGSARFTREAADMEVVSQFEKLAGVTKEVADRYNMTVPDLAAQISHHIEKTTDLSTTMPEAVPIANEIAARMKSWGIQEQDAGVLMGDLRDTYLPHMFVDTAQSAKSGGINGRMNVANPSGWKRTLGDTLEEANIFLNYHTSDEATQKAFAQSIYGTLGRPLPPRFNNGVPAQQLRVDLKLVEKDIADAYALQGLSDPASRAKLDIDAAIAAAPALNGTVTTFDDNALTLFLKRGLNHNKVIASGDYLAKVRSVFGESVGNYSKAMQAVNAGKTVVVSKESLGKALKMSGATTEDATRVANAAAAARAAGTGAPNLNATLAGLTPEEQDLYNAFMTATDPLIKLDSSKLFTMFSEGNALFVDPHIIEAYAFDPAIVETVNKASKKQIEAGTEALTNVFDKFYSMWKPLVTGLSPDYYVRNLVGGMHNNMLDLGFKAISPETLAGAERIGARRGDVALPIIGTRTSEQLYDAALRSGGLSGTHAQELTQANQVERLAAFAGVLGQQAKKSSIPERVTNLTRKGNTRVEKSVRLQNWLANVQLGLEKGLPEEAAYEFAGQQVRKFQFDYNDLTSAEKTLFRRIAPFYSWMRKNLPLQLEQALNNPAAYSAIGKAQRNFAPETDQSALPEYMRDNLAMPIPGTGNASGALFATLGLPAQDINGLSDPLKTAFNALSPLIKMPIEIKNNQSLLTGGPIWKETDAPDAKAMKIFQYLLAQGGVLGGAAKSVMPLITGDAAAKGTKPIESVVPRPAPGASLVKQFNVAPAQEQQQYALNAALKNQIAQTQAPTLDELKKIGYQYIPRKRRTR